MPSCSHAHTHVPLRSNIPSSCEAVPGYAAGSRGERIDVPFTANGIVDLCLDILHQEPTVKAIVLEAAEVSG